MLNINQLWESTWNGILKATEEVCGWTKGPARHLQTWWWNEEVAAIIDIKKTKFKEWHIAKGSLEEEAKLKEYIEAKRAAKKAVAKAQQKEREQFPERLDTKEGQRAVFRIAKQMAGERKDIIDMKCLKSENGEILTEPHAVNGRWKHYMEKLLNVENDWDRILEADIVEGPCELISERE